MAIARTPLTVLALLAFLPLAACGGDETCSPEENRCEGNVAWVCGGEDGARTWTQETCGESTTCVQGTCLTGPLVECDEADVGSWRCDVERRYPGQCTKAGYIAWDLSRDCAATGQTCELGFGPEGEDGPRIAACVMVGGLPCAAGTSQPSCRDEIVIDCTAVGLMGIVQDCAVEDKVCRQGACVSLQ